MAPRRFPPGNNMGISPDGHNIPLSGAHLGPPCDKFSQKGKVKNAPRNLPAGEFPKPGEKLQAVPIAPGINPNLALNQCPFSGGPSFKKKPLKIPGAG